MKDRAETIGEAVDGGMFISNDQLTRLWDGDLPRARRELRLLIADAREQPRHRGPVAKPDSAYIAFEPEETALLDLLEVAASDVVTDVYAPVDWDRIVEAVRKCTRREGGIAWVIPDGAKVVGCSLLFPTQFWWSNAWHVQCLLTYVHPSFRKSAHAGALLDAECWTVDDMTRRLGYRVYLFDAVISYLGQAAKRRLYRRKMTEIGASFVYPTPGS